MCKFIKDCPAASGWCRCRSVPAAECAEFLITAYKNEVARSKGYWIVKDQDSYTMRCECSNCGHTSRMGNYKPKMQFCMYCGARMNGGGKKNETETRR